MKPTEYKKRPGTSGINGQLYETKLISLIYFRAVHDDNIEEFWLATNIDEIGAFDDICFKAKVKGIERPVAVFIQAKHRESDKVQTLNSKNELAKYFDSYLQITRAKALLGGKFDETERFFVMYTTARDDPNNSTYKGNFANNLNDLIGTGNSGTQLPCRNEDVEFLCNIVLKEQLSTLAGQIAKFLCDEADCEMSMNDELVLRFHVILAQKVIDVSEIQPEGHRNARFREDFINTTEEFLLLFKDVLCTEILKKRNLEKSEIESLLLKFLDDPTEVNLLSQLIGTVITYKNEKFEFVNKMGTEDLKRHLDKVKVAPSTVDEAIKLAAKELLTPIQFKVPSSFGNKGLTIAGDNKKKIEKRLNHLTSRFVDLINKSKPSNIATIDETMEDGFLRLNGGIASAVGNILVADDTTKLIKFTDNYESLGSLAKSLYEKLKDKIDNLHEYKFDVKVKKFPKLSFESGEHDENLARDFYSKLLFYTNQADQNGVEEILKTEIEDYPCNDVNNFRVRSDAIFLKYHDEVQKMWMIPKVGSYLTKKNNIYKYAVNNTMSEPLIGVINMMHKIKNKDYTFNENALKSLTLPEQAGTIIVVESSALTVTKVEQCLKTKDHVVLDLEYIFKLPPKNFNTLCNELTNTNEGKIIIIVANNFQNSKNCCDRLKNIAKGTDGKQTIIITKQISVDIISEYFSRVDNVVNDGKSCLADMSAESQTKILKISKVKFQGQDLSLDSIVDEESVKFIEEDVLNKVILNETIVIGKTLSNYTYEKAKHLFVGRRVSRTRKEESNGFDEVKDKNVETLYDLKDDIVLLTGIPGMGKSTLLTHLSLNTKEVDPKVWIIRINLLEYSRQFNKWQKGETVIDTLESFKFMCQVALNEEANKTNELTIELEEPSNFLSLKKFVGDESIMFELRMFLNFYNKENLIFIFDGFDEIFPHYAREALALLKVVRNYPRRRKIWVTSRSYNEIKSILEQEFGISYEIEHFSRTEQEEYLHSFWKSKIQFKNLNDAQLRNVIELVTFLQDQIPETGHICMDSKLQRMPYFKVFLDFLDFLRNEFLASGFEFDSTESIEYDTFMKSDEIRNNAFKYFMNDFVAPPLHLFLLAEYFYNQIKEVNKTIDTWDLDISTYIIYEYYLEMKLKKIRFQEKNKIDIYNPDNMMTYEKERADFNAMHKKLGFCAIFYPKYAYVILNAHENNELIYIIEMLKKGCEKTGFVRCVVDNVPLFIHKSFAEYFAIEYICDILKSEKCHEKRVLIWNFILNIMFLKYDIQMFDLFNAKMKMDKTLSAVIDKDRKIIFEVLSKQKTAAVFIKPSVYGSASISREIDCKIDRITLITAMYSELYENKVDEDSLEIDFTKFFKFHSIRPTNDPEKAFKTLKFYKWDGEKYCNMYENE